MADLLEENPSGCSVKDVWGIIGCYPPGFWRIYNQFDFSKVNDNCFLLAFTGPTTTRGIFWKQDRPTFSLDK